MRLLKSTNEEGRIVWVAVLGPEARVYCYLHLTGHFHVNSGLHHDYFFEQENSYEDIDPTEAVRLINAGTGRHSERNEHIARRISESQWSMSAEEVLGDAASDIIKGLNGLTAAGPETRDASAKD